MINKDVSLICHECIGDYFLKEEVFKEGKRITCSYCGKSRKGIGLSWVAERIHSVIEENFQLTPDQPSDYEYALSRDEEINYDWYRDGQHVNDLIKELSGINDAVAIGDVQDYLSYHYSGDPHDMDCEDPYGFAACYERSSIDRHGFHDLWGDLRHEVMYRARFFNRKAEKILDFLFNGIEGIKTYGGKAILREIGVDTDVLFVYRARICQSEKLLDEILRNPSKELSSPPSENAKHGRMNPAGISVFYGATDIETCIAEVRPPMGSTVVIGKFKVLNKITLLDLSALSSCYIDDSFFAPEFNKRSEQADFLKMLVTELTKPVMPNDEGFEYLPTQAVAGYLSEKYGNKIVGIIFKSSQEKGYNIVLFHGFCKIKPYNLPEGSNISLHYGRDNEEDYDDEITRFENVPEESSVGNQDFENVDLNFSLSLDVNNDLYVKIVKNISYTVHNRVVSTYRMKINHENDDFFEL